MNANNKVLVLPKECESLFKKERKFCHACGGWAIVNARPCDVCDGTGSVTVLLPVTDEGMALAE